MPEWGPLEKVLVEQAGVVTRRQLLALGWKAKQIDDAVARNWRLLHRGVYQVRHRELPDFPADLTSVWAAVLVAGRGAAASHATALWLAGALRAPPPTVHVTVPVSRRVGRRSGVRIHVGPDRDDVVSVGSPPRTVVERSLLDATAGLEDVRTVIDLVLKVTQQRLTTPERVLRALAARPRHRWRRLLAAMLAEVTDGVTSMLEHEYLRLVERPHGLPGASRNRPESAPGRKGSTYRDVRYPEWGLVVELDGREAHPRDEAFRDRKRDNRVTVGNEACLRYGWRETVAEPCAVAAEVVTVLRGRGWTGTPRTCGAGCLVRATA